MASWKRIALPALLGLAIAASGCITVGSSDHHREDDWDGCWFFCGDTNYDYDFFFIPFFFVLLLVVLVVVVIVVAVSQASRPPPQPPQQQVIVQRERDDPPK